MQQYISAGLEVHSLSAKQVTIYLVQTDLDTGEKSLLAEMQLSDRSTEAKFATASSSYDEVQGVASSFQTFLTPLTDYAAPEDLPFSKFPPFRNGDPRATILDTGYFWLLHKCAKEFEEPDIRIEDDQYQVYAKSSHTTVDRSTSGRAGAANRPRRSKQNFKVWI